VRSTGQIGAILLRKIEKVKQGMRVEFVCGERAVRASRREYLALTQAAEVLSTATGDLPAQVARLAEELKSAEKKHIRLLEELAEYEARDLVAQAQQNNSQIVEKNYADRDAVYAKLIAKNAMASGATAAIISSSLNTPAIVLATRPGNALNAGAILKQVLAAVGGRGGGTAELAQGGVADQGKLAAALQGIRAQIAAAGS
jgi:alanyl-tRNA synthetase